MEACEGQLIHPPLISLARAVEWASSNWTKHLSWLKNTFVRFPSQSNVSISQRPILSPSAHPTFSEEALLTVWRDESLDLSRR